MGAQRGSAGVEARGSGRNGFQLDLNLCTGCQACVVACAIENRLPWGSSWRWVDTFNASRLPGIPVHHLSLACNHCENAPCARACPAVAYRRDPVTGAVLLDSEKCIGCRYCTWACPYDAPKYDPVRGVVSKCTFCNDLQREGRTPACANQCPTGALRVGPLEELEGEAETLGFPPTRAEPSIRFVPVREAPGEPDRVRGEAEWSESGWSGQRDDRDAPPASRASFRSEAPLWVFTLVTSVLVGVMATEAGRSVLPWQAFAAAIVVAASASTLHLGRKARAWRAALGWRTSWLSREIVLFNAFAAAGILELSGALPGPAAGALGGGFASGIGWLVAGLGFGALFAIDRVYGVTRTPEVAVHSAGALGTGVMVAGLVAGLEPLWIAILLTKLVLYGWRKHRLRLQGRSWRRRLSAVRVGSALAGAALLAGGTPVSALLLGPDAYAAAAADGATWFTLALGVALLLVGGAIDRAEFYEELEISTPAGQIRTDLIVLARVRAEA